MRDRSRAQKTHSSVAPHKIQHTVRVCQIEHAFLSKNAYHVTVLYSLVRHNNYITFIIKNPVYPMFFREINCNCRRRPSKGKIKLFVAYHFLLFSAKLHNNSCKKIDSNQGHCRLSHFIIYFVVTTSASFVP